jgi:hypothetical protein
MRSKVATAAVVSGVFAFAVPGAASAQAPVQSAYGPPEVAKVVTPTTPAPTIVAPAQITTAVPPVTEVRGVQAESPALEEAPAPRTVAPDAEPAKAPVRAQVAALPFTGMELATISLIGLALLGAGVAGRFALRRGARVL